MANRICVSICVLVLFNSCTTTEPVQVESNDETVTLDAGGETSEDSNVVETVDPPEDGSPVDSAEEMDGTDDPTEPEDVVANDGPTDLEETSDLGEDDPDVAPDDVEIDADDPDVLPDDPDVLPDDPDVAPDDPDVAPDDPDVAPDDPDVAPDDVAAEPDVDPCDGVTCGTGAHCALGDCQCNRSFHGDPDDECTPLCSVFGCGIHATCQDDDNCACDPGYSGTGRFGCELADSCKTVPVEDSVATLIYEGSSRLVRPTTGRFDFTMPITSPDDCQGGKIDIVILGEGYMEADMERFQHDAQIWLDDFLVQSPYDRYLGAFNVWTVPMPSTGHIAIGANADSDTRYRLALNDAGNGVRLPGKSSDEWAEMEAAVFDALDHVSRNTVHRYPDDGGAHANLALQTVAVMLILKPTCGSYDNPDVACDSFSGYARALQNPDSNEVVRVAIARNRLHEFGHAFGLLADEYRADDFQDKCLASGYAEGYNPETWDTRTVNNYAYASYGTEVPWQHLLYGAGINEETGIVGAYEGANTCWEGAWRSEFRCLMNGRHGNNDSCNPDGGVNLRQGDFCNWCEEVASMRVYEKVGWLDDDDPWADWVDDWRPAYWSKRDIRPPNNGMPIEDSCSVLKDFEHPPTGVPCEGHSNSECVDDTIAPKCGWTTSRDFSYCTRTCDTDSDCGDLFNNGCCAMGAVEALCRPAVDPRCMGECLDDGGSADADMCDDHVPATNWCGSSSTEGIYYCTRSCDDYQLDCMDLFPGGAEWGCCAPGGAGTSLCRPGYSPRCP